MFKRLDTADGAGKYIAVRKNAGELNKTWKASSIDQKIRAVCKMCNNGWMSDLEENFAKPVLTPLIFESANHSLSVEGQATIAAWAVKMAMVVERTQQARFYRQQERQTFMNTLEPPPSTYIWLGRYIGGRRAHCTVHNLTLSVVPRKGGTTDTHDVQVTTAAVGKFALQVLSLRSSQRASLEPIGADLDSWGRTIIRLWPSDGQLIPWPPPLHLDDKSLGTFRNRFNPPYRLGDSQP